VEDLANLQPYHTIQLNHFYLYYPLSSLFRIQITLITFGWVNAIKKALTPEPVRSIPVGDDPSHRCHPDFKGKLATTPNPDCTTLYEVVTASVKKYASDKGMGKRQFLGWKTPKIKEFGPDITWLTYAEMGAKAHQFGAALRAVGVVSAPDTTNLDKVSTPSRIAIFENTCPEWMLSTMGAFTQSITVTTVYATLGLDSVVEAVNDNIIHVIVCNKANVSKLVGKIGEMKMLKTIVYTNNLVVPNDDIQLPSAPKGVTIVSFDDFCASGDGAKYPATPPKPQTAAVVMYTSGSTGKPKGVMITHAAVMGGVASANYILKVKPSDKYLAYLPLAHILELMLEFLAIDGGCALCYADPQSLMPTGAYPIGALGQYAPSLMVAVPKIWEVIKKGVLAKVALSSPIQQVLVHTALEWRAFAVKLGFDTPLFNTLVFFFHSKRRWVAIFGGPFREVVR
jgi:long-chain acyl-CoA synthetase